MLSIEFPPGPGGIGTHAFQLARQLFAIGWQVTVVSSQDYTTPTLRDEFNRRRPFVVIPLPVSRRRVWQVWRRIAVVWRVLLRVQPQVVVASGSRALWTAAVLHAMTRIPWMAIGHGSEFRLQSPLLCWLTKWAVARAPLVVAVSHFTAGAIREAGFQARRICVIPNGADGDQFTPDRDVDELRNQLGLAGRRVLLTVGRVSERKAQDVVIRALPTILESCPDVVYLMVGLPEKEQAFSQLARDLAVERHVCFTGTIPPAHLADYYNLCDLFILVSRQASDRDVEGYGIVVLEAALCGRPAVVSNSGGLPETVEPGISGLIVPADDSMATAHAIVTLLRDEERRLGMGRKALQRARRATWEHRAIEYDRFLGGLVDHD